MAMEVTRGSRAAIARTQFTPFLPLHSARPSGPAKRPQAVRALLCVLAFVTTSASAQINIDNDVITVLENNPQLRQVSGFPPIKIAQNSTNTTDGFTRLAVIQNCPPDIFGWHPGLTGPNLPKCFIVGFRGAARSFESGYNTERTFYAVLFPNSPRVWRVYEKGVLLPPGAPKCQAPARSEPPREVPGPPKGYRVMAEYGPAGQVIAGEGQPFDPSCAYQVALDTAKLKSVLGAAPQGGAQQQSPSPGAWRDQTVPTFQCFVSTKDKGTEQVMLRAQSEDAAKVAALQHFGSRAFGMIGVACNRIQ